MRNSNESADLATKADIHEPRGELRELELRMTTTLVVTVGVIATLIKLQV